MIKIILLLLWRYLFKIYVFKFIKELFAAHKHVQTKMGSLVYGGCNSKETGKEGFR